MCRNNAMFYENTCSYLWAAYYTYNVRCIYIYVCDANGRHINICILCASTQIATARCLYAASLARVRGIVTGLWLWHCSAKCPNNNSVHVRLIRNSISFVRKSYARRNSCLLKQHLIYLFSANQFKNQVNIVRMVGRYAASRSRLRALNAHDTTLWGR